MIEFKGECGHTIRARDEDAGKVVRCSYCGREAVVAEKAADDLDMLFDEVEKTGQYDAHATKVSHKVHRAHERADRRGKTGRPSPKPQAPAFDPFAIALKMTYAAVIIIVIVVLLYQIPKLVDLYHRLAGGTPTATPPPSAVTPQHSTPVAAAFGLLTPQLDRRQSGVYVTSIPAGASIYTMEVKEGQRIRYDEPAILDHPNPDPYDNKTNRAIKMTKGKYLVAVALPIDNVELMRLPGYPDVRRKIEYEGGDARLLADYFVPDGSEQTWVAKVRDQTQVIRTYDVDVYSETWTPVTALFHSKALSLEEMNLPLQTTYKLDATAVDSELNFWKVPQTREKPDQQYIKSALEKVGKAFYREPSGAYLIFEVRIENGTLKVTRRTS